MTCPARFLTGAMALILLASHAPALAADTYQVDPVHSMILFRIRHLEVGNFYGRFNNPTGTITWDQENPASSRFEMEVRAQNVDTANQRRDDHLRSPDFFNAAQYPVITFISRSVEAKEEGVYEVTGDLTMHGVTQEVTVPMELIGRATDRRGRNLIGFEGAFELQRSDYGITFMQDGLGDTVRLIISLEAIRQ
jgi:polyisoprenoid-binding protein YceI